MPSRAEAIFDETQRLACRVLSDDNAAAQFLSRGLRTNRVGSVVATGLGELRDNARSFACGASSPLSRIGDSLFGTTESPAQCSTLYSITATADRYRANGNLRVEGATLNGAQLFQGPIQEVYIPDNNFRSPVVVVSGGEEIPLISNSSADTFRDLRNVVYTRDDGLPDDCGGITDPRPRYEGPVTYQDENGNDVTEDVTFVLDDPNSRPGGGLTIPVGWFAPQLNINPDLNLDLEPEIDFSPGSGCCPDIGLPDLDIPDGPDDPPEPGDQRRLVGVVVRTVVVDPNREGTIEGGPDSPDLYLPDCGRVIFAVRIGNESAWSSPIPVQNLKQWIPVLGEIFAYDVRVVPRVGYQMQAYPVYLDDGETQD